MVAMLKVVTQDPEEKLDYEFDFTSDLPAGDVITTEDVTASDDAVMVSDVDRVGARVVAWVEGGTIGSSVEIRCMVQTQAGRRFVRRTSLLIQHR